MFNTKSLMMSSDLQEILNVNYFSLSKLRRTFWELCKFKRQPKLSLNSLIDKLENLEAVCWIPISLTLCLQFVLDTSHYLVLLSEILYPWLTTANKQDELTYVELLTASTTSNVNVIQA